jgi:hypothetical protein
MASFSVSDSEDSLPHGEAGNVRFERKFSVADYTELLNQSGQSTTRTTPGPSKQAASSHRVAPARTVKVFYFQSKKTFGLYLLYLWIPAVESV